MQPLPGDPATRPGNPVGIRHSDLDRAVDLARERFGKNSVRRAALRRREDRFLDPDSLDNS